MQKIIGRTAEIQELKNIYNSGVPEFVVVYGRRRVGKTYGLQQNLHSSLIQATITMDDLFA